MKIPIKHPDGRAMKAWELLDSPEKWTQEAFARDELGYPMVPSSISHREPRSFCVAGAILCCYGELAGWAKVDRLSMQLTVLQGLSATVWNDLDTTTWKDVHALLRKLDI